MSRISLAAAIREVADCDPVLANLVALAGPITYRPGDPDGHFGALVRAITFQQLAGPAARAIHARVRALVDGPLTPEALAAIPDEALRAAGLSAAKLASLRDLSSKVLAGSVALGTSARSTDDDIVARLTTVRGIGRWTAEMYLMFELPAARRMARRRSRRPSGIRARLGPRPRSVGARASAARGALPAVPQRRGSLLLGGRRPLSWRNRSQPEMTQPSWRHPRTWSPAASGLEVEGVQRRGRAGPNGSAHVSGRRPTGCDSPGRRSVQVGHVGGSVLSCGPILIASSSPCSRTSTSGGCHLTIPDVGSSTRSAPIASSSRWAPLDRRRIAAAGPFLAR